MKTAGLPLASIAILAILHAHAPASRAECSEAEILALESVGSLHPGDSLVARIESDLALIRSADPFLERIGVFPDWVPSELLIELTEEAMQEYLAGDYHGLDELNAQYGPVVLVEHFNRYLHARFEQCLGPERLAEIYSLAAGVVNAEPNYSVGDDSDVSIEESGDYRFRLAWGDCPSGCTFEHVWIYRVLDGVVVLIQESGDPVPARTTTWGEIRASFRN